MQKKNYILSSPQIYNTGTSKGDKQPRWAQPGPTRPDTQHIDLWAQDLQLNLDRLFRRLVRTSLPGPAPIGYTCGSSVDNKYIPKA